MTRWIKRLRKEREWERERERYLIYVIPFTRKWFEKLSEAEVCNTLSLYSGGSFLEWKREDILNKD